MWTIFNAQGIAVANCDNEPDHADLAGRNEQAYFHADAIPLQEAALVNGNVRPKPLVVLGAIVTNNIADITIECSDETVTEVPLIIAGFTIAKPVGPFTLTGEKGITVIVDFDHSHFTGSPLEVRF